MTSVSEHNPLTDVLTGASGIHARAVPVSPSYFSRQPRFNDSYLLLTKLAERYRKLPLIPKDQVQPVAWKNLENFRQAVGEHVKATEFVKCMELVKTLNQIHPAMRPKEVDDALQIFKKAVQPYSNVDKSAPIDKFGRALGTGRRKTSVARAWVVEGTGEMLVNGKTLADAFGRVHDRESATWALRATGRTDKYNVWALVEGGGTTGQAEALTLAIGNALMAHEPALKPALRRGRQNPPFQLCLFQVGPTWANVHVISWLCYARSSEGRKEEARPCQGQKDARLGEEIERQQLSLEMQRRSFVSPHESASVKVLSARGGVSRLGYYTAGPFQPIPALTIVWHDGPDPPGKASRRGSGGLMYNMYI